MLTQCSEKVVLLQDSTGPLQQRRGRVLVSLLTDQLPNELRILLADLSPENGISFLGILTSVEDLGEFTKFAYAASRILSQGASEGLDTLLVTDILGPRLLLSVLAGIVVPGRIVGFGGGRGRRIGRLGDAAELES
jgi:hypothetical protein